MKFDFNNGIYDGDTDTSGAPSGKGVFTKPDSYVYEGGFVDGQFNGYGVLAFHNRLAYEGNFVNGDFNGIGKLDIDAGSSYEGGFVNGLFDGIGKLTLADGTTYEGGFVQGSFDGMGRLCLKSENTCYEGGFSCGSYHGKGRLYLNDTGRVYDGDFVCGQMTGRGKMTFEDGTYYDGEFFEGEFCGEGKQVFKNGYYKGEFDYSVFEGRGMRSWNDGSSYEGQFSGGEFCGFGRYIAHDGSVYTGEWDDGYMDGRGTLTLASGRVLEGIFEKSRYLGPSHLFAPAEYDDESLALERSKWRRIDEKSSPDDNQKTVPQYGDININSENDGMLAHTPSVNEVESGGYAQDTEPCEERADAPEMPVCVTIRIELSLDGSVYMGSKNNRGYPHGSGEMRYSNGVSYNGDWALGLWYGKGTVSLADGGKIFATFSSTGNATVAYLTTADGKEIVGKITDFLFVSNDSSKRDCQGRVLLRTVFELKNNILFTDKNDREHFTFSVIF